MIMIMNLNIMRVVMMDISIKGTIMAELVANVIQPAPVDAPDLIHPTVTRAINTPTTTMDAVCAWMAIITMTA